MKNVIFSGDLSSEYFEWMCGLVPSRKAAYSKLLGYLHRTEFRYTLPMDGNRYDDGINLRYRFGYECAHPQAEIAGYLDNRPCSVLEMMIALSIRCEEGIMHDADIGDRTGQWFWSMITSLGLDRMTDSRFDEHIVQDILDRFMEHRYERNGAGGLFTIEHSDRDLRSAEIWQQMNWYLDSLLSHR